MNKTELISAVSEKAYISKIKAGLVIDAITDAVTQALAAGDDVKLSGFGTFEVRSRATDFLLRGAGSITLPCTG